MSWFDTFTKEWPSSWNEPDVEKWKMKAKQLLKTYYMLFSGSQWDNYKIDYDLECDNLLNKKLLLAKICFAMFGPPSRESVDKLLCDGYTDDQKSSASAILDKILEVYKEVPSKELFVGIIFISCKIDSNEFSLPLFSIFASGELTDARASRRYVDTQRRAYKDWDDWKDNNMLPMLKYAYPRYGFFTSSQECRYEFDPDGEPDIVFGTSPQCDLSSRLFRQTDTLSAVTSLGCAAVAIVSMCTTLAPVVLLASAISGGGSAVYGTARAATRLYDKRQHNENLVDIESLMLFFSIAATPLNFTSSLMNASLVRGATANGRIFSNSTRMFATIINFSTLGVDTVLIGFGLANMIEKAKKDQLTKLDVVQFSMSLFFFTNTLIKPKVASKIIKKAQEAHIQQYSNSMSDEAARATLNKFVNDNRGTGSIKDTSKIVRTINRIENPETVFGGLNGADKVIIGGRKGKTLLVTDQNQRTNRVNPNKILFTTEALPGTFASVSLNPDCFKGKDISEVKVKGKAIFADMSDKEKARVNRVFSEAPRGNKTEVFTLALDMADRLGCENVDQFLSVVEIVTADVNKQKHIGRTNALNNIKADYDNFVDNIKSEIEIANQLANRENLQFRDPYKAVYHYRKHGSEFPSKIMHQSIEVYLHEVPNKLITDYNLAEIKTNQDGTITKMFNTTDNKFAVVVENIDSRTILTMHERHGSYATFSKRLTKSHEGYTRPDPLAALPKYISDTMGFRGCSIQLILENGEKIDMK